MITKMLPIAEVHGTRLWTERGAMPCPAVAKQYPSGLTFGGFGVDNSTGESASEWRHT